MQPNQNEKGKKKKNKKTNQPKKNFYTIQMGHT